MSSANGRVARRSALRGCISVFLCLSLLCCAPAANDNAPGHERFAAILQDAAKLSAVRDQLSESWQVLGSGDLIQAAQSVTVGRALAIVGEQCGLKMVWDEDPGADHYVWPIILPLPTLEAIKAAMDPVGLGGETTPVKAEAAAGALDELMRRGMAEAVLTVDTGQVVHMVFIDGRQVNSSNDRAVIGYSIASVVAGFDRSAIAPADADYSFLMSSDEPLAILAGTNKERFGRLCRLLAVTKAICSGAKFESASQGDIAAYLDGVDISCAADGEMLRGLERVEQIATAGVEAGRQR